MGMRTTLLRWTGEEAKRHPETVLCPVMAELWDGMLARPFDKADAAPVPLRELATQEPSRIILTGMN